MTLLDLINAAATRIGGKSALARALHVPHPRVFEWLKSTRQPQTGQIAHMLTIIDTAPDALCTETIRLDREAHPDEWEWVRRPGRKSRVAQVLTAAGRAIRPDPYRRLAMH